MSRSRPIWPIVRKVWAAAGALALIGFVAWSAIAYRASGDARAALQSDSRVQVTTAENHWFFAEADVKNKVGLLFFPGALVEPAAYAPLARAVALSGHPVILVELPRRGAFGGADGDEAPARARAAMARWSSTKRWVVAGHSRGAVVATNLVAGRHSAIAGLVLIGTSHPRDVDLNHLTIPVTKILGSRDGIAPNELSERNRHLLPPSTRWVVIQGGNHSQFGWYGFQPGDRFATIDRPRQQQITVAAIVEVLNAVRY